MAYPAAISFLATNNASGRYSIAFFSPKPDFFVEYSYCNRACCRHGRLTECFEGAGGNAAAATYIVIESTFRGIGYGNVLMALLEEESKRLGYHYLYLWTQTAVPFYVKIGYVSCHRVSLYRACLKQLEVEQISTLEDMLRQRKKDSGAPEKPNARETILLPPSDGDDNQADSKYPKPMMSLLSHNRS
jgi:GNAT superfamily N-acetyltransferase